MSNSQQMKKGLSVRDLITTGILAALYMVCAMIGEAIFGFFPVLTFLCPLSIALLCGPVYMLILAKVPKHGPIIVTGILVGGVLFVLGMYWSMCLAYCILGVVADLLAGSGNFRNKGRNLLSYMIFVLSPVFSYGMLWFDRDAYVQYLVEKGTEQTYMDTMVSTAQNWMLPAMMDEDHFLHLTDVGREVAEKIYERHCFFTEQLIAAGVDPRTAEADACRIEHIISDESFSRLKEAAEQEQT